MSSNPSMETVGSSETPVHMLHCTTSRSRRQYRQFHTILERARIAKFLEHVTVSYKRIFIIGGYIPERPKSEQEPRATILLPETKHTSSSNT